MTVTSTSGAPDTSAQIILRGAVSISGNNQPLFIVDGVPVSNSTFNQENYLVNPSNLAATPGSSGFANRQAVSTNAAQWAIRPAGAPATSAAITTYPTGSTVNTVPNQRVLTVFARGYTIISASTDARRAQVSLFYNR